METQPTSPDRHTRPGVPTSRFMVGAGAGLSFQKAQELLHNFRQACLSRESTEQSLDELSNTLQNAGYRHEMTELLAETLGSENANPHVGALWIRRLVSSKSWKRDYPEYLDELCERGEIGRQAVAEFLVYLSGKARPELTRTLLARHRSLIEDKPQTWSLAAAALAKAGEYTKAVHWTAAWQTHPGVDLRALHARALALRGLKKERKAHEVVLAALQKPEVAQQYPILLVWAAMEEGLAGNLAVAQQHLQQVKPSGWDDDSFCIYYLTRGLLRVMDTAPDHRKKAFYSSYGRIQDRFGKRRVHRRHYMVRRAYRRCVKRMAGEAGLWFKKLVVPWETADSNAYLLPLALIPGLQLALPTYIYRLTTKRRAASR